MTLCADTPAASEAKLTAAFRRADALQPCVLLLRNLQLLLRPRGGPEGHGRVPAALRHLLSGAPSRYTVHRSWTLTGDPACTRSVSVCLCVSV